MSTEDGLGGVALFVAFLASEKALRTVATLRALVGKKDKALEGPYRQADGWCCVEDSGNPDSRFADIAEQLKAALALTEDDMRKRLEE